MVNKKILVANWKAYIKDLTTVKNKIEDINALLATTKKIIICPPFIYLQALVDGIKNPDIAIGSQAISIAQSDASTGEILASMQKDIGCSYTMIGHSEVRRSYKETHEVIATGVKIALEHGIIPIICVGETISIRNNANYLKFLNNQLTEALALIKDTNYINNEIIVAYEPIWAIGTQKIPTTIQIEEVIKRLRRSIPEATNLQFLYGGSVNEDNIKEINSIEMLDGVLVGSASTDISRLFTIRQLLD